MINDEKIAHIFNYLRQNYVGNPPVINLPDEATYTLILEVALLLNSAGSQQQKKHFCFLLLSARNICDNSNKSHYFGEIYNQYNKLSPEVCAEVRRELIEWSQTDQISRCTVAV